MAVNKERALNVKSRTLSGDTETKKYNYINPAETATNMKAGVQAIYTLSNNTYLDAEVQETYSLNEAAADEE